MIRPDVRRRVERELRLRPVVDRLDGAIASTTATSFVLERGSAGGAPMMVEVDNEAIWVPTYTASTRTASAVHRGYLGTTAATHSTAAEVRINPRFTIVEVNDAINDTVERLSSVGLYRMLTTTATYSSAYDGYGLPAAAIDVYQVRVDEATARREWPKLRDFEVIQHADTVDFPNGVGLVLRAPGWPGRSLRITYRARYAAFTNDTEDTATDLGIQSFARDLLFIGTATQLMSTEEVHRTDVRGALESRRAQESPPRHAQSVYAQLEDRFAKRVDEVQRHLRQLYPPQTNFG